ncbi:MAG TPA: adenosylcobinamide-GDP ribazoletransferase [Candidatus Eisenbergiella merdipullorum]|uniref:Adenosylcobinamide-GDP ribazoletransferase n=1 Tax=Candidatus Eisenbergiella merdipullorum TaxID=2838553 RepID=A0A9D2KZR4_9FIRM|nr:adenosylcobinamide-GDP ribazoletransferase [Candidatus Eisenbergiella merdipullorum]
MKQVWNSFRLAFSMYSIIPARQIGKTKENMRYLLCFVPWVGAVVAFLISEWRIIHPYLLDYELLRSVICVMIPLLLSGGAHMDGFFRTVDALSSHQTRKGKLDILQDSHSGYFAIITCVSYFLIVVGLWSEMPIDGWPVVAFGFILSRSLYGLSILWFPHTRESKCSMYVPEDGKGKAAVTAILVLYTLLCVFFMLRRNMAVGIGCLIGALLAFLYYSWVAFKHFGGITEDIASFFVQVCEILIPIAALLVYRMPTDFTSF